MDALSRETQRGGSHQTDRRCPKKESSQTSSNPDGSGLTRHRRPGLQRCKGAGVVVLLAVAVRAASCAQWAADAQPNARHGARGKSRAWRPDASWVWQPQASIISCNLTARRAAARRWRHPVPWSRELAGPPCGVVERHQRDPKATSSIAVMQEGL